MRQSVPDLFLPIMVIRDSERRKLLESHLPFAVKLKELGRYSREGQTTAHDDFAHAEMGGNIGDGLSFRRHNRKSLELVDRMQGLGYASSVTWLEDADSLSFFSMINFITCLFGTEDGKLAA
ncbi:hypothetical protein [Rhizobium sp. BR 362]|uniref:hypothetical protein n=1 Tax=Rhizobium sp. BR 362 TaxID=3040670 RepID=UPI002F3EF62E